MDLQLQMCVVRWHLKMGPVICIPWFVCCFYKSNYYSMVFITSREMHCKLLLEQIFNCSEKFPSRLSRMCPGRPTAVLETVGSGGRTCVEEPRTRAGALASS